MNNVLSDYQIEAVSNLAVTLDLLGRVFLSTYVLKAVFFYTSFTFTEWKRTPPVKVALNETEFSKVGNGQGWSSDGRSDLDGFSGTWHSFGSLRRG